MAPMPKRQMKYRAVHDDIVAMVKANKTRADICRKYGGDSVAISVYLNNHGLKARNGRKRLEPGKKPPKYDPCHVDGCDEPKKPGNRFLCDMHYRMENVDLPFIDSVPGVSRRWR